MNNIKKTVINKNIINKMKQAVNSIAKMPCRLCGKEASVEHKFPDPNKQGPDLYFCSAKCLYEAEHMFDDLSPATLQKLRVAINEHLPN